MVALLFLNMKPLRGDDLVKEHASMEEAGYSYLLYLAIHRHREIPHNHFGRPASSIARCAIHMVCG